MAADKSETLRGTLDLMVLKTLEAMGPLHGYGIARRIEQISEEALQINQGTIYPSLVRLIQKGWISGTLGTSDNNRKGKSYSSLASCSMSSIIARLLRCLMPMASCRI